MSGLLYARIYFFILDKDVFSLLLIQSWYVIPFIHLYTLREEGARLFHYL